MENWIGKDKKTKENLVKQGQLLTCNMDNWIGKDQKTKNNLVKQGQLLHLKTR